MAKLPVSYLQYLLFEVLKNGVFKREDESCCLEGEGVSCGTVKQIQDIFLSLPSLYEPAANYVAASWLIPSTMEGVACQL